MTAHAHLYEQLEDAIRAIGTAEGWLTDDQYITNWILVGAAATPDPEINAYFRIYAGSSQAPHINLGLLDYATQCERANLFRWEDEDPS